ncbi:MAG: hypothetical protein Q8867_01465 [Bacteroidota bacterium]|nr:hypothetical protein [Bacteroidota bacterium]
MLRKTFIIVGLFAIAMAFLESAVVIYLREIYYPGGFGFPLKPVSGTVSVTEVFREAATMVMLVTVALLAEKDNLKRFAFFIYSFAIWDIFYYVFLYLLISWPSSLLTWDLLFLLPCPWTGPVLAPVINSMTMILLAVLIVEGRKNGSSFSVNLPEWFLLVLGSILTIVSYLKDYLYFMISHFHNFGFFSLRPSQDILEYSARFSPVHFNWFPFIAGEILFFIAMFDMMWRIKRFSSTADD